MYVDLIFQMETFLKLAGMEAKLKTNQFHISFVFNMENEAPVRPKPKKNEREREIKTGKENKQHFMKIATRSNSVKHAKMKNNSDLNHEQQELHEQQQQKLFIPNASTFLFGVFVFVSFFCLIFAPALCKYIRMLNTE